MTTLEGLKVTLLAGTLGQGGAERQLFHAASTLQRAGARPRVLTLGRHEFWEAPLRDAGVPVEWAGARVSRVARLADILRAVARDRPDVIQSYHFYANLYAAVTGRVLGVPVLGAIRSSGVADLASVDGILGRLCLRLPPLLVANSEAAIVNLTGLGVPPRRLRVLPNVIDTTAFVPGPGPGAAAPFEVAGIGRLSAQKRFDRALRVIAALRNRVSRTVRLTIVGEGALRGELEALVTALGLHDCVRFTGAVADVRPVLRDAHCLLLTSDYEGTPNVVLEAMGMARPVVATSVGGIETMVEPRRTGFICAPEDEAGLCHALAAIADDPSLGDRLGRAGRDRVEQTFSLPSLEANLRRLYDEVVVVSADGTRTRRPRPGAAS